MENFWAAGYVNVIAGSFLRRYTDYVFFRQMLRPSAVFLIDLLVDKEVRDHRRITRGEADHAGMAETWSTRFRKIEQSGGPPMLRLPMHRHYTTDLDVGGTVQRIKGAIPDVYAG